MAAGSLLLTVEFLLWYSLQLEFAIGSGWLVLRFFVLEAALIAATVAGLLTVLRFVAFGVGEGEYTSLRRIVADSLSSRVGRRVAAAAGALYFLFYAFVSSTLVLQPGVDFGSVYGFRSPGVVVSACCGSPGTVPSVVVFVSPQLHLALQLVPLNVLFLAVVPLLVGVNVAVSVFSYRNRPSVGRAGWAGALASFAALFTSCPACAGYFLASSLGGLGAASAAALLAPYQLAFIAFSIPVLAISPVAIAASLRSAYISGCAVEGRRLSSRSA